MKTNLTHSAVAAAIAAGIPAVALAGTQTIDFESLSAGTVVTNQISGVTVSADNVNNDVDVAVIFDSETSSSVDADLNSPWSGGNIAADTVLGNLLILQENGPVLGDTIGSDPDDEGRRPAGNITFAFDQVIRAFGMDIVDVEGPVEFGTASGFNIAFFLEGIEVADVAFGQLITPGDSFFDGSIEFGDNFANRINPITAAALNVEGFDTVIVSLGGSGGIDNVVYTTDDASSVPTPSAAIAGLALLGLTLRRRRQL